MSTPLRPSGSRPPLLRLFAAALAGGLGAFAVPAAASPRPITPPVVSAPIAAAPGSERATD